MYGQIDWLTCWNIIIGISDGIQHIFVDWFLMICVVMLLKNFKKAKDRKLFSFYFQHQLNQQHHA